MSRFFDAIDKYKFGILAALSVYIGIFMYMQLDSYDRIFEITPFHDGSYVDIPKEDIKVDHNNVLVPSDFQPGVIKNMVANANDDRPSSYDDYSEYTSSGDVQQSVHDFEDQLYRDAGGDKDRERIQRNWDKRNESTTSTNNPRDKQENGSSSPNRYAGETMVKHSLKNRTPYQNNTWYVRNPGYTSFGSGTVWVDITVNQNGNVISATVNASKSPGATARMIEQALKYAKMSRFNYSSSAPKSQRGWIKYIFDSRK
jgi:hypothetical protein